MCAGKIIGESRSTVVYTYGNDNRGDLLTDYNGMTITYDEIGNPDNWRGMTNLVWVGQKL